MLRGLFEHHSAPYSHAALRVRVRPSRRSAFSGSCYYRDARLFINVGRRNRYPFVIPTHVARARTTRNGWSRVVYQLTVADAYQLALFVYLHELYHYLVSAAGRGIRRREGMCDRFAVRRMVAAYGCPLLDYHGRPAPRAEWDFQDVEGFVAAAPRAAIELRAAPERPAIPVRIIGAPAAKAEAGAAARGVQRVFGFVGAAPSERAAPERDAQASA